MDTYSRAHCAVRQASRFARDKYLALPRSPRAGGYRTTRQGCCGHEHCRA